MTARIAATTTDQPMLVSLLACQACARPRSEVLCGLVKIGLGGSGITRVSFSIAELGFGPLSKLLIALAQIGR